MTIIWAWVRANIIPTLLIVAVAIGLALFGYQQWQRIQGAKTEANLAKGQAGAALASGKDAVNTIGNQQAAETGIHETVKEGTDDIAKAPAGDSNDAADRAACRLRSYRHTPKCIALLGPAS